MAFSHSFSATGTSPEFYGLRGGFDWAVTRPGAETISLTLEQEINGAWYTKGSAVSTSVGTRISHGVDYTAPCRFRINCGAFDTSAIAISVVGDIVGDAVMSDLGAIIPDSWLLEDGTALLLETGDFWLLEAA